MDTEIRRVFLSDNAYQFIADTGGHFGEYADFGKIAQKIGDQVSGIDAVGYTGKEVFRKDDFIKESVGKAFCIEALGTEVVNTCFKSHVFDFGKEQ